MPHALSLSSPAAASPRLSPLEARQKLLTYLLERHYGLALNDTPFCDDAVIQERIERSWSPMDAVNFIVDRCGLVRIDRNGFTVDAQEPFLTPLLTRPWFLSVLGNHELMLLECLLHDGSAKHWQMNGGGWPGATGQGIVASDRRTATGY